MKADAMQQTSTKTLSMINAFIWVCILLAAFSFPAHASVCDALISKIADRHHVTGLSATSIQDATRRAEGKAAYQCANENDGVVLGIMQDENITGMHGATIYQASACVCCKTDAQCQTAIQQSAYQEKKNTYVANNGKSYKRSSKEGLLAFTIDSFNKDHATDYIRSIEAFKYPHPSGTCSINFKEAPNRYLDKGVFYDEEIDPLHRWKNSQFDRIQICLEKETESNTKRLDDYFYKEFEKKTQGATDAEKKRHWIAATINEEIAAKLDSTYKKMINTAAESYNNNDKAWKSFVNSTVLPALKEGRSIDRAIAAERQAKIDEENRPARTICTNCNQGSELDVFARSLNQAANKYIRQPQQREAKKQARNVSTYVQMTKIRDRLYVDNAAYQRGANFHLKAKEHRPISLTPNSSTPPLTKPEKAVACPRPAHEYQEGTACWCIATGKRCKTVLK